MLRPYDRSRVLRKLSRRLAVDSVIIVIASVMAFGQVKNIVNGILRGGGDYEPIYMIFMIFPMALSMGLVSWRILRGAKRRLEPRKARSVAGPGRRLAAVSAITAASMASCLLIDYLSFVMVGDGRSYSPPLALAMAIPTGGLVGMVAWLRLGATKRFLIRSASEARREAAAWSSLRRVEAPARSRDPKSVKMLRRYRIAESAIIVLGAELTFGFVDFLFSALIRHDPYYNPIDMIGMIVPMAILMGVLSYASLKRTSRALVQLVAGIELVGNGDFRIRLDKAHAGPYRELFTNFNSMCAELQGIQTLRDDFINHFSHEFKTPITSVNGFAKILLEESVTEEERRRYLGIIASESERLGNLANNSLMMARLDSQHYVVDKALYPLDEQLKQCAILLSPQWTKKGIDLSADLEPVEFLGNADLMLQVWINILGNAIKFTPSGGKVTIRERREGDSIAVSVVDTGKGMAEEELSRAFDKFYQGESSSSAKGLGLGLAIVHRIVGLSGGRIEARSAPGEGSEFTVFLPAL